MNPARTYDYLTQSRARVLDQARALPTDAHSREFPVGLGTLLRTLTHIMICEWAYIERMAGRAVPTYAQWPIRDENPPPLPELEQLWAEQAELTRAVIASVSDWDAPIEYRVAKDDGRAQVVTTSPSDLFTQLALHEVHHRAQALNILRQLGADAGEIDFNSMMHARRDAPD